VWVSTSKVEEPDLLALVTGLILTHISYSDPAPVGTPPWSRDRTGTSESVCLVRCATPENTFSSTLLKLVNDSRDCTTVWTDPDSTRDRKLIVQISAD
jgi:hypothetical protein